ncbi:zinc finger protein 280C isoform X2 [Manis pentadactyla]|uniref:zinc finger protein 280C isoform X2 n=1 Tax=Manis pentadactyla TaxID=143292 RepID=UPI00255C7BDD|nr:zinc finger protein 280C isoform X2 [Manis pentadactyla]
MDDDNPFQPKSDDDALKPTTQHRKDPEARPVASLSRIHPKSKSSQGSVTPQSMSKPDFTKNTLQVELDDSSDSLFDSTQVSIPLTQQELTISPVEDLEETLPTVKPFVANVSHAILKMPKTNENTDINPSTSLSSASRPSVTYSHVMVSKGTNVSPSTYYKTEALFRRSCPKCNIKFNLLDPLKCHMKRCCPDMINMFLEIIKAEFSVITENQNTGAEKGKLIMTVSDFYYGKHEGTFDDEEKTYTTFKCISCLKVLKNNIRFMNHMNHHLELERQNSEIWGNQSTCQRCYRQYPTPFHLQCHIESTHTPHEFPTICKICELSFQTEHMLLQHMKDTHKPGEMPYICQVCQFRSSSFSDVDSHFRASHENTKNLLCPFCLKVSRMATPYMHHYMKHQNKGVYHCSKCRLQFLTYNEKLDHKTQHRTFIKPKELEGLPPGTKVTIRASIGPLHSGPPPAFSSSVPSTSFQISPSKSRSTTVTSPTKSKANQSQTSKLPATISTAGQLNANKQGKSTSKYRTKTCYKYKKQRKRKNKISTALKNLRCPQGVHRCIECLSKIKDFASHFSIRMHCNICKYNTNCNKAFGNHMMSFHGNQTRKRVCIFKKHSRVLRGITLVCLKCDFVADSSGLDRMAKHLSRRKTHTCQVIIENVPASTSTSKPTSTAC